MKRPQVLGEAYAGLYMHKTAAVNFANLLSNTSSLFPFSVPSQSICSGSMTVDEHWHARLGHLPFTKLHRLGLSINNIVGDSIKSCLICSKARQQRLPFPHSQIYSTHVFELVYIDLWGSYRTQTYNGYKYFLTIVDDYSRTTWTHLLATKSNAVQLIKAFIEMAFTQFHARVQTIRSDNALELGLSEDIAAYFFV